MKFHLVDDMHLEFSGYTMPGDPDGILLLAGDIMLPTVYQEQRTDQKAEKLKPRFDEFFKHVSENYKQVYYIAGNHEFYNFTWEDTYDYMRKAVNPYPNIRVLDKEWVDLGNNVHLFGSTLWTDFHNHDPMVMSIARRSMNDYRLISQMNNIVTYGKSVSNLEPQTVYDEHCIALQALKDGLETRKGKSIVVMTHHAPSPNSCHPRYGADDPLNWAYYSALDEFILDNPSIRYWVHGHTHDSHDYMIGSTRVLCNPRGYSYRDNGVEENFRFNDKLEFEV